MKYNKITALLALYGKNLSDYASYMGIVRQQIANKKKTDTFKADELIKLAELTNTQLAFIDKKTGKPVIIFDLDDLTKK